MNRFLWRILTNGLFIAVLVIMAVGYLYRAELLPDRFRQHAAGQESQARMPLKAPAVSGVAAAAVPVAALSAEAESASTDSGLVGDGGETVAQMPAEETVPAVSGAAAPGGPVAAGAPAVVAVSAEAESASTAGSVVVDGGETVAQMPAEEAGPAPIASAVSAVASAVQRVQVTVVPPAAVAAVSARAEPAPTDRGEAVDGGEAVARMPDDETGLAPAVSGVAAPGVPVAAGPSGAISAAVAVSAQAESESKDRGEVVDGGDMAAQMPAEEAAPARIASAVQRVQVTVVPPAAPAPADTVPASAGGPAVAGGGEIASGASQRVTVTVAPQETALPDAAMAPAADAPALLRQAREAFWRQDYPAAVRHYRALIEISSDQSGPYGELGNVYYAQGKWQQAARAYAESATRLADGGRGPEAAHLLQIIRGLDPDRAVHVEGHIAEPR